jgi:4,5-DOPA dioxygenase extradiol
VARMPAFFFGHGNPMNAIEDNRYSRAWAAIGAALPRPRGVLAISAHWSAPGPLVTAMSAPPTIHDFGGFPPELYRVEYPAPGDPALAARARELLAPFPAGEDRAWGLDHGTWSVLRHVFPNADIPVVQLSLDETRPLAYHYEVGKRLRPLRDEGVLVMGSGNVVHNIRAAAFDRTRVEPFDWAARFDALVRDALVSGRDETLVDYPALGRDALLSAPTPEHYLPLLSVAGAREPHEPVTFPVRGIEAGSLSMLSVRFG